MQWGDSKLRSAPRDLESIWKASGMPILEMMLLDGGVEYLVRLKFCP